MKLKKYEYEVKKNIVNKELKEFKDIYNKLYPINLNGVFNKCAYLLDVPMEEIKEFAKKAQLIDINYVPRVHYNDKCVNSKMDWHINLILISTIVNFANTQEIIKHFDKDYPLASLTVDDIKTNLVYWSNNLHNNASKYINDYLNHFNITNPDEIIKDKITYYSNHYKDIDTITNGIDLYSPMVNCQVHQFIKLDHINYGQENEQFKKCGVNIRVYGGERNESIKSVRTLDGSKCLYMPLDIKMKLFSWYNQDSKSCRKYIRTIAKDIFPNKKNEEHSIFNLFTIMTVFNKRNPDRLTKLDDNSIEVLKEDLNHIFNNYKDDTIVHNATTEYTPVHQKATSEVISIREDVVVKEEEIDVQNVSKEEINKSESIEEWLNELTEREPTEREQFYDKLSNDDYFTKLLNGEI